MYLYLTTVSTAPSSVRGSKDGPRPIWMGFLLLSKLTVSQILAKSEPLQSEYVANNDFLCLFQIHLG